MPPILKSKVGLWPYEMLKNESCAENLMHMKIKSPELAKAMVAGQFLSFANPCPTTSVTRIPLSPSRIDTEEGTIDVVYATIGVGTRALARMTAGDVSDVVGPSGRGWDLLDAGEALLVAGGVGAPPIVCAARELVALGVSCTVVLAARSAGALWGEHELEDLPNTSIYIATDDGSQGYKGYAIDAVRALLRGAHFDQVYACGPNPMLAGVAAYAEETQTPCQVSLERMMGCAFGACGTCNVSMVDGSYKSCCMDGPIFSAKDVSWQTL